MIPLFFSILSSTAILIIFKTLERLKIDVFHVIIINYAVAFSLGLFLNRGKGALSGLEFSQAPWIILSMFIGVCLIAMFFVIGVSTQKTGISVTTISSKLSVVIPMLFSIFYYNETITTAKTIGIFLALCALVCAVLKKQGKGFDKRHLHLPLILFFGMGLLDVSIKFVQYEYISDGNSAGFASAIFFFAFISGSILCLFRQVPITRFIQKNVMGAGILLGICNFGSIFFLVNALNSNVFDSSIVFGINSIGIVGISIFSAFIFFKERLSVLNWVGVSLSIAAISIFIRA